MGYGDIRQQQRERQSYADQAFTSRDEYFYYRNLRMLITELLKCTRGTKMDVRTRQFLGAYNRLVEKCKSKNRNCNWECYGGVIVMEAMRDDTEFQNEYKSLQAFLERRMDACNKRTNPAEKVMTDEEIRLVVYEKPGLIGRCAHPSEAVQMTACKQSPSVVQFIDEPTPAVVDMLAERHPKNVLLIKTQFRTAKSEIKALNAGVLGLNQINKTRLVSNDYNATEPWNENEIVNMVRLVEENRKIFTPEQLETFRLNIVGWRTKGMIKYMRGTSNAVKERAVQTHPDCIRDIRHQYPELQEMALCHGFKKQCENLARAPQQSKFLLSSVYKGLLNPDANITKIYGTLKKLYDTLGCIRELPYQNEQVQLGCLYLASAGYVDVMHIFQMFNNPSQNVQDLYADILQRQMARTKQNQMGAFKDLHM